MYKINNAQEEDLPPRHARARLFLQSLDVLLLVVVVVVFCWSATTSAEEEDESVNGHPLAITLVRIVSRNTIHTDEDGRTDGNSVRRVNPSKKGDAEGGGIHLSPG